MCTVRIGFPALLRHGFPGCAPHCSHGRVLRLLLRLPFSALPGFQSGFPRHRYALNSPRPWQTAGMEHKTWATVDKSAWGDGPWQDEPDKEQWPDEATGEES